LFEHGEREECEMVSIRKSDERGRTKLDWLDSRQPFFTPNRNNAGGQLF
jgi:hypothetical protein